ncbi:MAG: beta-ketoacyl synthase N-terminal-like domain-containing protein [Patescibacteria group bacterium]
MTNIVITGMGLLSAAGDRRQAGRGLLGKLRVDQARTTLSGRKVRVCELGDHFATAKESAPSWAHTLDRSVVAALSVAQLAMENTRLAGVNLSRYGVYLGSSRFSDHTKTRYQQLLTSGEKLPKDALIQSLAFGPAFWVAKHFGIEGPTEAITSACTGSLQALMRACDALKLGYIDAALVCGVETSLTDLCVEQFAQLGVCSKSGICRAFDKNRDGTIPGEGAAAILLETEKYARARGRPIFARVCGYASVNDGFAYANDPSGNGIMRAIHQALQCAHLMPEDIDVVNAHAPGTVAGDLSEGRALEKFSPATPVYTAKPLIGHCNGAASLMETVLGIDALNEGVVPGNYCEEQDPGCGDIYLPRDTESRKMRTLLKISSGIGGVHAAAIFQKA